MASPGSKVYDEVAFYYFLQYHLHVQLGAASAYIRGQGLVLKGDIPIGIYRYSCDAWMEPSLYHMDMQAGAPPDPFAVKGQNWGFPTYNWQEMAQDGFAWWKKRFEQMSRYFDAFRIDHILGFFRIWSIPMTQTEGIMGIFDPAITVKQYEFADRGIWFDHTRYTHPFVNDAVLWEYFGPLSDEVKNTYFLPLEGGLYRLKEAFETQRRVEEYFAGKTEENADHIRTGILRTISNVILHDAGGSGNEFHFAVSMESTPSFRYLDWGLQQRLHWLYIDYFYRRQDDFWRKKGLEKLPALKRSTNMLICGEDLGTVTPCVPEVMGQLGILALEVQRMPKTDDREFFHPADAPYLVVVTPSTHDMSTIRGWWEEDPVKTQRFYNNIMGQLGNAPVYCEPWINRAILVQHLYSPAMWSIFQLQDIMGMSETFRRENPHDERINDPADAKNKWKYRMHLPLEDLIREKTFNQNLRALVEASGRG